MWQLRTAHNQYLKLLSKLFSFPPVWPVIKQTKNLEFRTVIHIFYVFIQILIVMLSVALPNVATLNVVAPKHWYHGKGQIVNSNESGKTPLG